MATEYVIIASEGDGKRWIEVGVGEGASSQTAIRSYLNDSKKNKLLVEDSNGTYIAIPKRSWQPVKVKVETALKFG